MNHFFALLSLLFSMKLTTPEINAINKHCYDHKADRWLRSPFENILPDWVDQYHPSHLGMDVLDIGSGNGVIAAWLKEKGLKVLCLDPSDEMVRRCRAKGLKTLQTTIQEFKTDQTFASIFAILSLIHVPKSEFPSQIEKIASYLPKDGLFFLALIEGNAEEIREKESGYPRFFSTFEKKEVLSLVEKDFELVNFEKVSGYMIFALQRK